ncbi:MAG: DNA repair protein RecO [Clostridia bacterium]|nr:DNA repair protein RecO [Clostridia bacterium]
MSQTISTQAIVLRAADYGEADRMLTLLSPEHGKISAKVRGCRKAGAKLAAAAQVFQSGEYFFAQKSGRLTLAQCLPGEGYYGLRQSLPGLTTAAYFCNLCEEAALPGQSDPELYNLLREGLAALCQPEAPPNSVRGRFLMRFLVHQGYAPRLDFCASCHSPAEITLPRYTGYAWDPQAGGLICYDCIKKQPGIAGRMRLSADDVTTLRDLQYKPLNDQAELLPNIIDALQAFLHAHMDRRFHSLEMLSALSSFSTVAHSTRRSTSSST